MAYSRRELERTVSVPYINYLDGVEFRIGDRFQLPKRVALPVNYHQKDPSELISQEYDFTVENEVLRWAEERRREEAAREAEKQARREAQAHVASLGIPNTTVRGDLDVLASATDGQVLRPQIAPVVANMSTEVLQPVPTHQARHSENNAAVSRPHHIDIADFEVSASDPFEATELKSINEMEELSRVLQSSYPNAHSNGMQVNGNSGVSVNHEPVTDSVESTVSIQASSGQVSFSRDRPTNGQVNDTAVLHTVPNGPVASTSPMYSRPRVTGPSAQDYDASARPLSRSTPLPPIHSTRPASVNYDDGDFNSVSDSSRSTSMPDIARQVNFSSDPNDYASFPDSFPAANDFASVPARAATPPPPYQEMSSDSSLNRYTPLPPPPHHGYHHHHHTDAPPAYSATENRLPNPYGSMGVGEKQFVDRITGMGFPQHRTARAVQRLGQDDKQVIDTLCAIERLVEQGYREERVENAVNFSDDENQAVEFLKMLRQFEELGFKQEDITNQLLLHGVNQEKVLDGLTAS